MAAKYLEVEVIRQRAPSALNEFGSRDGLVCALHENGENLGLAGGQVDRMVLVAEAAPERIEFKVASDDEISAGGAVARHLAYPRFGFGGSVVGTGNAIEFGTIAMRDDEPGTCGGQQVQDRDDAPSPMYVQRGDDRLLLFDGKAGQNEQIVAPCSGFLDYLGGVGPTIDGKPWSEERSALKRRWRCGNNGKDTWQAGYPGERARLAELSGYSDCWPPRYASGIGTLPRQELGNTDPMGGEAGRDFLYKPRARSFFATSRSLAS